MPLHTTTEFELTRWMEDARCHHARRFVVARHEPLMAPRCTENDGQAPAHARLPALNMLPRTDNVAIPLDGVMVDADEEKARRARHGRTLSYDISRRAFYAPRRAKRGRTTSRCIAFSMSHMLLIEIRKRQYFFIIRALPS